MPNAARARINIVGMTLVCVTWIALYPPIPVVDSVTTWFQW
jgi:hypothetical protein